MAAYDPGGDVHSATTNANQQKIYAKIGDATSMLAKAPLEGTRCYNLGPGPLKKCLCRFYDMIVLSTLIDCSNILTNHNAWKLEYHKFTLLNSLQDQVLVGNYAIWKMKFLFLTKIVFRNDSIHLLFLSLHPSKSQTHFLRLSLHKGASLIASAGKLPLNSRIGYCFIDSSAVRLFWQVPVLSVQISVGGRSR